MSQCLICNREFGGGTACYCHETGVCDQCKTHAAIGRAVSELPEASGISHVGLVDGSEWVAWRLKEHWHGPTPLDALRAAGLCDEP